MKKFISNILLLIVAILLATLLLPIGFVFGFFASFFDSKLKNGFYYFGENCRSIAYSIDQLGNTTCAHLFNHTLIKRKEGYLYGNPDETISGVTGKNKIKGTLTKTGMLLDCILESFEENHSELAIENDEQIKN